jgi:hypothetical protein
MPSGIPTESQVKAETPKAQTTVSTPPNSTVTPPVQLSDEATKTADEEAEALMKALQG